LNACAEIPLVYVATIECSLRVVLCVLICLEDRRIVLSVIFVQLCSGYQCVLTVVGVSNISVAQ
jgi:hypothetical protein